MFCFSVFYTTYWTKLSIAWWLVGWPGIISILNLNWYYLIVHLNLTADSYSTKFISKLSDIIQINLFWHSLTLSFLKYFINVF